MRATGCGYSDSARTGAVRDDHGTPGSSDHSHGSLVAGAIAAAGNNGKGIAGVAWNVRIMTVKVLDCGPLGSAPRGEMTNVAAGIDYARRMGARVINLSLTSEPGDPAADIAALPVPDIGRELRFVMDAVALIRRELAGRAPLIGFAGSPWTVATYMVEGGSSREFAQAKALLYGDPKALHALLAKLARATADYLNAQVAAGAQAVMIFDTWGGVLTTPAYYEFSLAYMEQVVAGLTREREGRRVPVILFTKGGGAWLERLGASGADALGIDWTTELSIARRDTFGRVALQGNLDPGTLFGSPASIRAEVARVLESYGRGPGHVFNLGHGIQPGVDPEHVAAMVAAVQELSPQYHR